MSLSMAAQGVEDESIVVTHILGEQNVTAVATLECYGDCPGSLAFAVSHFDSYGSAAPMRGPPGSPRTARPGETVTIPLAFGVEWEQIEGQPPQELPKPVGQLRIEITTPGCRGESRKVELGALKRRGDAWLADFGDVVVGCGKPASAGSASSSALADHCWSAEHFSKVGIETATFVQFVDEDLVLYHVRDPSVGQLLECAHGMDNATLIEVVRRRGIAHQHTIRVIPD